MRDKIPFLHSRSAFTIRVLSFAWLLWATGPWLQPASAQQAQSSEEDPWAGVEEMLVTGSEAASLLGDIAQANSVTAFDSETLQALGAGDITDLAAFTPNLEIVTAGTTSPTFFIRGIGLNDFNANAAGAVAIYQDDVALNSPALQLGSLFDIESTNVLRGPQGTGAYRNASAGSIKVYSKKPSGDFGAELSTDYGNFNFINVQGAVEFPIVEGILSGRVAFRLNRRGGLMKNRCAGLPGFANRPVFLGGNSPGASLCGDSVSAFGETVIDGVTIVTSTGQSAVQPFQRKRLNQERNFSARGVLRFQPDLAGDVEMDWLLIARGSRIDQPSTVGQSIATGGTTFFPEATPLGTLPRDQIFVEGLLGGSDQSGYQDLDITNEVIRLVPGIRNALLAQCAPCTNSERRGAGRDAQNIAKRATSFQLARDLDSDPFTGAYSSSGTTRNETFGLSLRGDTDIGDNLRIKTVLGYDRWKRHVAVDLDFSPNIAFETETNDRGKQVYADLSFSGTLFEDTQSDWAGPIEWEVGAYTLVEKLDVRVDINFGINTGLGGAPRTRRYTQTVESFGGYSHLSWDFLEVFTLDGGVRLNRERRGIDYKLIVSGDPVQENNEFTNTEPTGTVRLTYQPTTDISMYAKYTRGWKSGTFNATGSNFRFVTKARPEQIDAFEVGTNQSYFDGVVLFYLSFFHYAYQDYQLFTSQAGFQQPPSFVILNAQDVELFGSEFETTITPWEGGMIQARLAWLEGQFLEFVQTDIIPNSDGLNSAPIPRLRDNSGNRLLNAPKFTVNLTAQQSLPVGEAGYLTARWDGVWKDTTFYDSTEGRGIPNINNQTFLPKNTIGQGDYWIHNVRLSFRTADGMFELAGWVRNVTNQVYKTYSADLSIFQKTTLNFIGDPRTFGMTLALKF